jgi:hypothetical protein
MTTTIFKLETALYEKLRNRAHVENKSMAEIIRLSLRNFLGGQK